MLVDAFQVDRIGHTFSLTVFAQEWRVTNNAVESTLHLSRQLNRFLKVVAYKLFENCKALIVLQEFDLRSTLVLA